MIPWYSTLSKLHNPFMGQFILSANEKIFQESSKIYMDALKNIYFREEFIYQQENIPNDINKENKKKKTLKICYSCTKNIFQIINNHDKEII